VPVPYFLLFLCFRKDTQEIFSELDETKAEHPEIYRSFQRTKEGTERSQGVVSPPGGMAQPLAAPPYGEGHWPTSNTAPSPIKTPRREKPKHPITFPKYIAIRCRRQPEIGRVQKLFLAPCRRGESPPEVFFIAMLASSAMSE
jgi:hypothetical protein